MKRAFFIVAALIPSFARAETVSIKLGPLGLHDKFLPMTGPSAKITVHFKKAGWVRGFHLRFKDSSGASADHRGIFCHSTFQPSVMPPRTQDAWNKRAYTEPSRLTTAEGQNEMVLPEGFGVFVDSGTDYVLDVMLQNQREENYGDYAIEADLDVVYRGDGPDLKTVHDVFVLGNPAGHHDSWAWTQDPMIAPGAHEYVDTFTMPRSGTVVYLWTHFHQYVERTTLVDPRTKKVLFAGAVKNREDGWPEEVPTWSSAKGFHLVGGKKYEFHHFYNNPLDEPVGAMSVMRLYVHYDSDRR